jgi:hypothetical protein
MSEIELLKDAASIAKDLTLTAFMLWFIFMMISGRIVRREELDQANRRTETADAKSDWWRDRYLAVVDVTRESISSLKATVEAGLAAIRRGP